MTLYVPFETIEAALIGADETTWTESERKLVAAFRKVVARRRRGLPDDPLHRDEES
jgi:hypothetical protein